MRRLSLGIAVLLATLALTSGGASAHAALVSADPAANSFARLPPREITLRFSEPVDERVTRARVIDASGVEIASGQATFPDPQTLRVPVPALVPGFYSVAWENVSRIDGHGLNGSFPFTILEADGSVPEGTPVTVGQGFDQGPDSDGLAVRWLLLLGLAGMAGFALLTVVGDGSNGMVRPLVAALTASTALALVAAGLSLVLVAEEYGSVPFREVVWATTPGRAALVRLAVVGFGLGAALLASRRPRVGATGALVAAGVAVFTLSITSHAAAADGHGWGTAIDWLHGVAAVAWIGGVAGIAVEARRRAPGSDLLPVLRLFSRVASASVFVLLSTGFLQVLVHFRGAEQLAETRYGGWLLIKLALLVPLLGLARYNARVAARLAFVGGRAVLLARTAGGEALLGIGVFAIAAGLTQITTAASLPPNTEAPGGRFDAAVDDVAVVLAVDPNRTGFNSFAVSVLAPPSAGAVQGVRLAFTYADDPSVGPATLELLPDPGGGFTASGPYLPLAGNWDVEAFVRFEARDDLRATMRVRPAGAPFVGRDERNAWDNPATAIRWNQFGGVSFLIVGLGLYLTARSVRPWRLSASRTARVGSVAAFGFAAMLLFGVHRDPTPPGVPSNPIPADRNSVMNGQVLYEANCARCHGTSGVPPRGLDLDPYPLDLTVHAPLHPDGILYRFIADGVAGSAMIPWSRGEGALTDDQIWDLVNFLRTLRPAEE